MGLSQSRAVPPNAPLSRVIPEVATATIRDRRAPDEAGGTLNRAGYPEISRHQNTGADTYRRSETASPQDSDDFDRRRSLAGW